MRFGKRLISGIMVGALVLTLSGCGPFPEMTELSEEDQEQIALYCSRAVSKFNIRQDRGLVALVGDSASSSTATQTTEPEVAPSEDTQEDSGESEQTAADDQGEDTSEDTGSEGDSSDDTSGDDASATDGEDAAETETKSMVTLSQAIGVDGVTFLYKGAKVSSDYRSGDVYDLTPDEGNELVVVRVKAKNTTDRDMVVDLMSLGLRFEADYNGVTSTSQATLLLNDLTTFDGTIRANRSKNLVILFQYPEGTVKRVKDISLSLPRGSETYYIDTELSAKK